MASTIDFEPIEFEPLDGQQKRKKQEQIQFEPIEFESIPERDSSIQSTELTKPVIPSGNVDKEIQERGFLDRPLATSETIKKKEIEEIARKHGVNPADLRNALTFFGGVPEEGMGIEDAANRALGFISEGIYFGIPQKIIKKLSDDKMEGALDDLQSLASGRKSAAVLAAEAVTPGGLVGAATRSLGKAALKGAAAGAVAGASGARSGQELEGALFGAGVGGIAGGVSSRLASRAGAEVVTPAEKQVAVNFIEEKGPQIEEGTERLLKIRQKSNDDIRKLMQGQTEMDQDMASRIVNDNLDEASQVAKFDSSTPEGSLIRKKVERTRPEEVMELGASRAIERELAQEIVDEETKQFAKFATRAETSNVEEAREAISSFFKRQGGEPALDQAYKLFKEEQAAQEYIRRAGGHVRVGRESHFISDSLNKLSDAQFVIRDMDSRFGTAIEPIHRDLNRAVNRMSYPRASFREALGRLFKSSSKEADKAATGGVIARAMESGKLDSLTPEQQRLATGFRAYFDRALDFVNRGVSGKDSDVVPLSIPKRKNYVPSVQLDTPTLIQVVNRKAQEAANQLGVDDLVDLKKIPRQSIAEELSNYLSAVGGQPITTGIELSRAIADLGTRKGRVSLETMARSALERNDTLPDWAREWNIYKLADGWTSNTLKHLYLRRDINKLASMAKRLEKAGGEVEARYLTDLLEDIKGVRPGTAASATLTAKNNYLQKLDRMAEGTNSEVARGAIAAAKAVPEILGDMSRQVYQAFLGLSPRAIIMNATQPFAKTAPELGSKYGYSTVLRGTINAYANLPAQLKKVEEWGLAPAEFVGGFRDVVADGIRRSSLYRLGANTAQGMADASLKLYSKMDTLNRAIAVSTAEMMASDLARGSRGATQALQKLPSTVRRQVSKAQSQEEVARILASHLNASTQYNYNRASMSEWGRKLGPLLSTFSKWPTATAGEIVQEYRDKGLVGGTIRNADKFIAPYLLFQLVDYLFAGGDVEGIPGLNQKEVGFSDRQKKLLGKAGLSGSAPIGTIESMVKGDFFTPPLVDSLVKGVVIPALDGDQSKLKKGLSNAAQSFLPGTAYVRFLTDDLPTIVSGRQTEGSDFLERTDEGMRRLKSGK